MIKLNTLSIALLAAGCWLLAAGLLALPVVYAATITKTGYQAGKTRINADYKTDKAACATLSANANDICVQEAKAKVKVALAELEYGYTGKTGDHNKVQVAKAESA